MKFTFALSYSYLKSRFSCSYYLVIQSRWQLFFFFFCNLESVPVLCTTLTDLIMMDFIRFVRSKTSGFLPAYLWGFTSGHLHSKL